MMGGWLVWCGGMTTWEIYPRTSPPADELVWTRRKFWVFGFHTGIMTDGRSVGRLHGFVDDGAVLSGMLGNAMMTRQ